MGFNNDLELGFCFELRLTSLRQSLAFFYALRMMENDFLASCCYMHLDLVLLMAIMECGHVMEFSNITRNMY